MKKILTEPAPPKKGMGAVALYWMYNEQLYELTYFMQTGKISASDCSNVNSPIITGATLGSFTMNVTNAPSGKSNVPANCKCNTCESIKTVFFLPM